MLVDDDSVLNAHARPRREVATRLDAYADNDEVAFQALSIVRLHALGRYELLDLPTVLMHIRTPWSAWTLA